MAIELTVPSVGESVTEVEVGDWLKREGDLVRRDEAVVVLETDKATMEIYAPTDGTLGQVAKPKGAKVSVGEVIGYLEPGGGGPAPSPGAPERAGKPAPTATDTAPKTSRAEAKPTPKLAPAGARTAAPAKGTGSGSATVSPREPRIMPAAARVLAEKGMDAADVPPTGPGGRLLKEDVERATANAPAPSPAPAEPAPPAAAVAPSPAPGGEGREEELVPLSLIRRKIAERLLAAQNTMALLTTFNEVDMSAVRQLRAEFQDKFQERYQIKLGFMSFFVKAVIEALKDVPALNAEIRDQAVAYRNYFDIGIAIGGGRGLVVPVLRNAERHGFAEIEKAIADFGARARENRLKPEELAGGTFTITNGGVYGSLLSTPLINAPQSGVLGMHAVQDRPVVRAGQVVIRPMMYLALTYDHRIVDGREAVTFLRRVKELVEQPARILLEA